MNVHKEDFTGGIPVRELVQGALGAGLRALCKALDVCLTRAQHSIIFAVRLGRQLDIELT